MTCHVRGCFMDLCPCAFPLISSLTFFPWHFSFQCDENCSVKTLAFKVAACVFSPALKKRKWVCIYISVYIYFYISWSGLYSYRLGCLAGRYPFLFCSYHHAAAALRVEAAWQGSVISILLLSLTSPALAVVLRVTQAPKPPPSLCAALGGGIASQVCCHFPPTNSILSLGT